MEEKDGWKVFPKIVNITERRVNCRRQMVIQDRTAQQSSLVLHDTPDLPYLVPNCYLVRW